MRVLAATDRTDPRPGGSVNTLPGELIVRADKTGRDWLGVASQRTATVAVVTDKDITEQDYRSLIVAFLTELRGWNHSDAEHDARVLAEIAADYTLGQLVTLEDHDEPVPAQE
jgi:hypothetical protein